MSFYASFIETAAKLTEVAIVFDSAIQNQCALSLFTLSNTEVISDIVISNHYLGGKH